MLTSMRVVALVVMVLASVRCGGQAEKKPVAKGAKQEQMISVPKGESKVSPAKIDLLKTIAAGRALLTKKAFDTCKVAPCEIETFLAIANQDTGALRIVSLDAKGQAIEKIVQVSRDLTYSMPLNLGPGDAYKVDTPKDYIVVAAKRRVHVGSTMRIGFVYTPYSEALDTPEVRAAGAQLLQSSVETAVAELREEGIISVAHKKKLVADTCLPELVMILPIIEQFRHSLIKEEGVVKLLAQNLTVFGANGGDAYLTVQSGAGALGALQLMPTTYGLITKRYGDADLGKNYLECASNLVCAAKVAILLNDSDLAMVPKRLRPALLDDAQALARYLAAAYNTGGPRAVGTLKEYGGKTGWSDHIPKQEARDYVMKLDAIWPKVYADHKVVVTLDQAH